MAVADLPPFTQLLGVNVLHRSPERSEAELIVREELCNRRGVLHGGAVMALGDTLGGITAPMESKPNFFAAVPKGDTAHAVCIPLHRGRTTMVLETRITRGDGKLAAIVTQTQLIFGSDEEECTPPSPAGARFPPRFTAQNLRSLKGFRGQELGGAVAGCFETGHQMEVAITGPRDFDRRMDKKP